MTKDNTSEPLFKISLIDPCPFYLLCPLRTIPKICCYKQQFLITPTLPQFPPKLLIQPQFPFSSSIFYFFPELGIKQKRQTIKTAHASTDLSTPPRSATGSSPSHPTPTRKKSKSHHANKKYYSHNYETRSQYDPPHDRQNQK